MSEKRRFFQYVIPSIGAMLVSGLYFVIDGIFVGRGIGTRGLAAVNLSVPFISLLIAIPMMIALGGASLTSISFGKGETEQANKHFNTSLFLVIIFALFMSLISILFPKQIAILLGANDELLEDTATYLKYFVLFGVFFSGAMTLAAFVRNDGNPKLAFWGMTIGACLNIFFDWLFVFPLQMGLKGAAIASGLGQVAACLLLSFHFILKKGWLRLGITKISIIEVRNILKTGFPEFVTQMNTPITTFCYNQIVIRAFGEIGVSAFSVVAYLLTIILAIFIGLAQGIQPLLSLSRGKGETEQEKKYLHKGLITNVILALSVYLVMLIFGKYIIAIFNSNSEMISIAYNSILIYGISFPFAAINIVYTTYFLSIKQTGPAILIALLRSFILNVACIFIVPTLFGTAFIWGGIAIAEALDTGFILLYNSYKKRKKI